MSRVRVYKSLGDWRLLTAQSSDGVSYTLCYKGDTLESIEPDGGGVMTAPLANEPAPEFLYASDALMLYVIEHRILNPVTLRVERLRTRKKKD